MNNLVTVYCTHQKQRQKQAECDSTQGAQGYEPLTVLQPQYEINEVVPALIFREPFVNRKVHE